MPNKKISELPSAGALSGPELVELVKGGINSQSTAQDVANLSNGANIDRYTFPFPQFDTATSTTAYTGTPSPAISAYATGQKFQVKVHATSTGASTLNLNGLGAKKVYTNPTTQATTGNLLIDQVYILVYDEALDAAAGGFLMVGASVDLSSYSLLANTSVAITDAATMDITGPKHTLSTSSATRTFTQSWTGDFTSIIVTLSATSSVFTFPAGALCVSDGLASGDNTLPLNGVSGDKYYISISKFGSAYYVVSKNFGQ